MPSPLSPRPALALACAALLTLALAACGTTVSTGSFKGEEHEVAQAISNLQADATAGEQSKICARDLAAPVVTRLGGAKACQRAIKSQLAEIDNLELSVQSIKLGAAGTATATVKSTYAGKKKVGPVLLAKEGGKWKVSSIG